MANKTFGQLPQQLQLADDDLMAAEIISSNKTCCVPAASVRDYVLPAGLTAAFAMASAPAGWLKCNGAAVSRTTYAALFAAIGTTFGEGDGSTTFNLPDLRGEFVRGWDDGRGVDAGRTLGSAQGHAVQNHTHGSNTFCFNTLGYNGGNNGLLMGTNGTYGTYNTGTMATGTIGAETRPRSVALLFCVKY